MSKEKENTSEENTEEEMDESIQEKSEKKSKAKKTKTKATEKSKEDSGVIQETEEPEEPGEEEEEEEDSEDDYLPTKRVIKRRKSKREKEHPLASAIRLALETGKVELGTRRGIKNILTGKAKLFVIANNIPIEVRELVLKYSKSSETPILEFDVSSMNLGSVCGKPFSVSILSIYDTGVSNILDFVEKDKKK